METERQSLLMQIWAAQDTAYDLMYEYDSLPHQYGANTLFQAEAHLIDLIALHPDITIVKRLPVNMSCHFKKYTFRTSI